MCRERSDIEGFDAQNLTYKEVISTVASIYFETLEVFMVDFHFQMALRFDTLVFCVGLNEV